MMSRVSGHRRRRICRHRCPRPSKGVPAAKDLPPPALWRNAAGASHSSTETWKPPTVAAKLHARAFHGDVTDAAVMHGLAQEIESAAPRPGTNRTLAGKKLSATIRATGMALKREADRLAVPRVLAPQR